SRVLMSSATPGARYAAARGTVGERVGDAGRPPAQTTPGPQGAVRPADPRPAGLGCRLAGGGVAALNEPHGNRPEPTLDGRRTVPEFVSHRTLLSNRNAGHRRWRPSPDER